MPNDAYEETGAPPSREASACQPLESKPPSHPYLEKKATLQQDLHQKGLYCLNLESDQSLLGTTTYGEGPLCVFSGSYEGVTPRVFFFAKLPKGIESHLTLGGNIPRGYFQKEYPVEVFYCLQRSLLGNSPERDKYISIKPHFPVFNQEEVLRAKSVLAKKIDRSKYSKTSRAWLEAKKAVEYELGAFRSQLDQAELEKMIWEKVPIYASGIDLVKKQIEVLAFTEMIGEQLNFITPRSSNDTEVILHEDKLSPVNLCYEQIPQWEGENQQYLYFTSFVKVHSQDPSERRIIVTIHRIVPTEMAPAIEARMQAVTVPTLGVFREQFQDFFPELGLMEKAVEELGNRQLQFKQITPPVAVPHQSFAMRLHLTKTPSTVASEVPRVTMAEVKQDPRVAIAKKADEEKINQVYARILALTQEYVDEHREIPGKDKLLSTKKEILGALLKILQPANQSESKYQRLENYVKKFTEKPPAALPSDQTEDPLKQHRTARWLRYVGNIASTLTVFPLLYRTVHSCYKYHTPLFWKPQSEKLQMYALGEWEKIRITP